MLPGILGLCLYLNILLSVPSSADGKTVLQKCNFLKNCFSSVVYLLSFCPSRRLNKVGLLLDCLYPLGKDPIENDRVDLLRVVTGMSFSLVSPLSDRPILRHVKFCSTVVTLLLLDILLQ